MHPFKGLALLLLKHGHGNKLEPPTSIRLVNKHPCFCGSHFC
jgi:hypothetical protein